MGGKYCESERCFYCVSSFLFFTTEHSPIRAFWRHVYSAWYHLSLSECTHTYWHLIFCTFIICICTQCVCFCFQTPASPATALDPSLLHQPPSELFAAFNPASVPASGQFNYLSERWREWETNWCIFSSWCGIQMLSSPTCVLSCIANALQRGLN